MNLKILLYTTGLVAVLSACDTSTHKYISFETDSSAEFQTIFGWKPDSSCNVYTYDTTITYNDVQLLFYKDNSTLNSFPKKVYEYFDAADGSIDSALVTDYFFDLKTTDKRVVENDSILVIFKKGRKKIKTEVLYKKESESTLWDRAPLPKLH